MTGPLIFITLGVLLLLNNLYPARFEFTRMWPVVLIVIGLVKIVEHFGRGPAGDEDQPGQGPYRPRGFGNERGPAGTSVREVEAPRDDESDQNRREVSR